MKPLKWKPSTYDSVSDVVNGHYDFAYSSGYWAVVCVADEKTIHNDRARSYAEAKRAAGQCLQTIQPTETV